MSGKTSAQIRAGLSHPVIDSDGHSLDLPPLVEQYIAEIAGPTVARAYTESRYFTNTVVSRSWYDATPDQRVSKRLSRPSWWGVPAGNALDLATAQLPRLLHERLPEAGVDVSVLYAGRVFLDGLIDDQEMRLAACRATNLLHRDLYKDYADRLLPVAVIPTHTPEEAIAELEYCVKVLGYRAVVLPSFVRRPIPEYKNEFPRTFWFDTYGLDSAHNYDSLWAKCLELKVAPTFHSPTAGMCFKASISNFTYNHIGHFAQSAEAVCKSLFMGGVTQRFPELRFGFLEGGVGWATNLLCDLVGHWKKRKLDALDPVNPAKLNRAAYFDLCQRYGEDVLGKLLKSGERDRLLGLLSTESKEDPAMMDEFGKVGLLTKEDFHARFLKPFFFGCEGDDPLTGVAFDERRNPLHTKLNAVLGSDIGHFDVPDISEVLEETYEAVEDGAMSEDDFRDFVFINPIKLWTAANPDFFKGTAVESEVAKIIKKPVMA